MIRFSRQLRLGALLASSCLALASSKLGLFDIRADTSGTPSSLSLSVLMQPAQQDLGKQGDNYVAAAVGPTLFVLSPNGWVVGNNGIPAIEQGPLGNVSVPVLSNMDVTSLECAQILGGYGLNLNDMLSNTTYKVVYQVPAQWPRTSPLPCSSFADSDIARFLEQATFGPTIDDINLVKSEGIPAWLNSQFSLPPTLFNAGQAIPTLCPTSCTGTCTRDGYSPFPLQIALFQNALNAQDQLRQRVAFALSQILVISGNGVDPAYAIAGYENILINGAFGNYEDLLTQVALSPAMGSYLNMANNGKPLISTQQANENFARELMQLFSIGVNSLNADGTGVVDANGLPIPSYNEDTIKALALAFTGWTYPPTPGLASSIYNPAYYQGPMISVDSNHDTSAKVLLNGTILPQGQTARQDLTAAIHNVFMHPNVGPFIGKQLIEHLVTSNPSPAYVTRISTVFNDNGNGVRGDLKAVVRAILLDPEARGGMHSEVSYGHLKEPVLYMTHLMRALGTSSDGVWPSVYSAAMGQNLYFPDSVFSYYPPDNTMVNGTLAPELAIYSAPAALMRANFVTDLLFAPAANYIPMPAKPDPTVVNSIGTYTNLGSFVTLASNPSALVDQLDLLLLHGNMTTDMRSLLINQVTAAGSDPFIRAKTAIYLIAISSEFQVER